MSDHEKHTEFLKHCLRYDESDARRKLEENIVRIQRDLRCVGGALWLMGMTVGLATAGLIYAAIFVDHFPDNLPRYIAITLGGLELGSFVCLVTFAGLWAIYRWKLDRQREECRLMVAQLLETRLGKPAIRADAADVRMNHDTDEGNASRAKIQSPAEG